MWTAVYQKRPELFPCPTVWENTSRSMYVNIDISLSYCIFLFTQVVILNALVYMCDILEAATQHAQVGILNLGESTIEPCRTSASLGCFRSVQNPSCSLRNFLEALNKRGTLKGTTNHVLWVIAFACTNYTQSGSSPVFSYCTCTRHDVHG